MDGTQAEVRTGPSETRSSSVTHSIATFGISRSSSWLCNTYDKSQAFLSTERTVMGARNSFVLSDIRDRASLSAADTLRLLFTRLDDAFFDVQSSCMLLHCHGGSKRQKRASVGQPTI